MIPATSMITLTRRIPTREPVRDLTSDPAAPELSMVTMVCWDDARVALTAWGRISAGTITDVSQYGQRMVALVPW